MEINEFHALCQERRSIRYFSKTPVTKEEVLQLLEVAQLAPSIENLQPWHFHVIFDQQRYGEFMQASCYGNFVEGAGAFILVTVDTALIDAAKETVWNAKELEYSCMAAMDHLLLAATAMGLGSCWVSLHHGPAHAALALPMDERVVGGIMLGHYKKGEEKSSGEHVRKPLEEIYTFHE